MAKVFSCLVENDTYYFDKPAALRVIEFVEKLCKLSDPLGQPFILLDWQRQIVLDVFGWKRRDNQERRFTSVYIEVPRKQGKTYFVAALLLYLLMADQVGAECYASACSRDQSGILFKSVRSMVEQSDFLSDRLEVIPFKGEIKYRRKGTAIDATLKALSGESVGSHGKYPTAVVCDELHEWATPKAESLYEALTSGFGNRKSPLVIHITTAGYGSQPTLAKRLHEKAKKFAEGACDDPSFYGVVYGADLEDDWTDVATWQKANPSWTLAKKNLEREFPAAQSEPSKENTFRRLYLNQWTQQQTRWLDLSKYDLAVEALDYEDYKGRDLILGVDLGPVYDLTAIALLYPSPEKWTLFVRCFMPQKQIEKRSKEDNIPYDVWAKQGWIIPTWGAPQGISADYKAIYEHILGITQENNVLCVGFDPAGTAQVTPELELRNINCLPIYPKHNDMDHGAKEFERRISTRELVIEDNPCLRWQAGNVEVEYRGEQIRPVKPDSKGNYRGNVKYKVDGITAAVIAAQTCLLSYRPNQQEAEDEKPQIFFV